MIILHAQGYENVTFWRLGDINFKVSLELHSPRSHQEAYSNLLNFQMYAYLLGSVEVFSGKNPVASPSNPHKRFQPVHLWT